MSVVVIVIIIAAIVVVLYGALAFNRLIRHRNQCEQAFADVDAALKRRHDLIPSLVETVKGYASHERDVFERVTDARSNAIAVRSPAARAQAEEVLTGGLRQLLAVSEAYPDLKASENFIELQQQLAATEDEIQSARRDYNANVRGLNTAIQSFPASIVARIVHISEGRFFEVEDRSEREGVSVSFNATP